MAEQFNILPLLEIIRNASEPSGRSQTSHIGAEMECLDGLQTLKPRSTRFFISYRRVRCELQPNCFPHLPLLEKDDIREFRRGHDVIHTAGNELDYIPPAAAVDFEEIEAVS